MNKHKIGILFALCTSLCWAVLAIILKYALEFVNSGSVVWIRMSVASIVLILFFSIKNPKQLLIFRKPPLWAIISALCLATNYFCYMKGLELTNVSNTQIMIQSGTILLILAGIFYFKERLSLLQGFGILCALFGFYLFYLNQILYITEQWRPHLYGNLVIFIGGACWALFTIFQKKLSQHWAPQQLNVLTYTVSALVLITLADFNILSNLNATQWCILIALGFNTLVAYGCLAEALKRAPASYVGFMITLDPLITIAIMQVMSMYGINMVDPEPLSWHGYAGTLLVVCGISLTLLIKSKKK